MIYLDYAATAPMRTCAIDAMTDAMRHAWGNPSSIHGEGARAKAVLEVLLGGRRVLDGVVQDRCGEHLLVLGHGAADGRDLHGVHDVGKLRPLPELSDVLLRRISDRACQQAAFLHAFVLQ